MKSLKRAKELKERENKLIEMKNVTKVSMSDLKRIELTADPKKKKVKPIDLQGNAFCCLKPDNSFRLACAKITHWEHFDSLVMFLILFSTVLLCLE